jgi:hypothetical protein
MISDAQSVVKAALSLPVDDRAELAERLSLSLGEEHQAELESIWETIVTDRVQAIDQSQVKLIPHDEAMRLFHRRTRA